METTVVGTPTMKYVMRASPLNLTLPCIVWWLATYFYVALPRVMWSGMNMVMTPHVRPLLI